MRTRLVVPALTALALVAAACKSKTDVTYVYSTAPHWPSRQIVPANVDGFAITTDNLQDTLSWVDPVTMQVVDTLPVGLNPVELEGPHHLVTSPDGQYVYFGLTETFPTNAAGPHGAHGSGTVPGYVQKIRVADGAVVGSVRVDRNPGDILITRDGSTLYVSHFDVKRILDTVAAGGGPPDTYSGIAVIDTATMTRKALVMICPAEHGMALSSDEKTLYVACYGSDQEAIVDVTTSALTSTLVPIGPGAGSLPASQAYQPYASTLSPDGKTVWISCWVDGSVHSYDIASGTMDVLPPVFLGGYPTFGDVYQDRVYIAGQVPTSDPSWPLDRVLVIGSDGSNVATWTYPPGECVNAHAIRMMPSEPGHAMLVCEGNHVTPGSLLKIDLTNGGAVLGTAHVGIFPDGVTYVGAP